LFVNIIGFDHMSHVPVMYRQRQQQPHDPVDHQQGHKQQQQQQQLSQLPCHGVQNQTLAAQQQIGVTQDWDQPGCQQDTLVAQLLAHLQQHQQQQQHDLGVLEQQLQLLDTQHLTQLILLHAAHARSMHTQQQLSAAQGGISALASEAHVKMKQLTRQQLADIAYGLAHWDVLQWHCQQQQQQQQDVGLLPQHATQQVLPAGQEIPDDRCCHGRQQWLEQQQQRCPPLNLQYSSCFQQELKVPFLVLPNLFPYLHLDNFMKELSLKSDIIRLTDESGAVREVNESRMTDWQSDVGATFCYSGKEMVPTGEGLTAQIAQVILICNTHITGQQQWWQ
jgi:hypothetical protein